jgi:hypothetical protein
MAHDAIQRKVGTVRPLAEQGLAGSGLPVPIGVLLDCDWKSSTLVTR